MTSFFQDARYALRMLARKPGFAIVAIAALALGSGGNIAMFSVIDAVLLRPLPFTDPARLVMVYSVHPGKGWTHGTLSPPDFLDYRAQNRTMSGMFGYNDVPVAMATENSAERLHSIVATPEIFKVLGIQPTLGRGFLPEDGEKGHEHVVVLSDRIWHTRFGGDRSVIGRTIRLDGELSQIVGVMPASFSFAKADIFQPFAFGPNIEKQRGAHYITVIGRLKPGVSIPDATGDLKVIAARLAAAYPDNDEGWSATTVSLTEAMVGNVRPALLVLLGAVAMLALIACANIANLLLARATERERELAVRTAMGASRFRLIRQLLTESAVLSALGSAAGIAVAALCLRLILRFGPASIPRLHDVRIDIRVLVFALAAALVTAIISGLVPAVRASRQSVSDSLKAGALTFAGGQGARLRNALMVGEVAVSLMLLIGAGLLIKSFVGLRAIYPGFDVDHVLTFELSLPQTPYTDGEKVAAFYERLQSRLRALPGVQSASSIFPLPMSGDGFSSTFEVVGSPVPPNKQPSAQIRMAGADYFKALRIPLIAGRFFDENDARGTKRVLLISAAGAKKFFPGGDAMGKQIKIGASPGYDSIEGEVVGIVGDTRDFGLDLPVAQSFYALPQQIGAGDFTVVVRSSVDPEELATSVQSVVRELDPMLPVSGVAPMNDVLAQSLAQPRFYTFLLALFAGVAVTLAVIGVYGVISYSVNQRVHEIGIRLALGAQRGEVLWMVIARAGSLVAIGAAIGLALASALARVLQSLLFGISSRDAATYLGVTLLLLGAGFLACLVPAHRASRVDPMVALRWE